MKSKLFAAAIILAILVLPCFSCRTVPIPTHTGTPVISMTIDQPREVYYSYVAVYEDGDIIYYEDVFLHSAEYRKYTRTWYEGQINSEGLFFLEDAIWAPGFAILPDTITSIPLLPNYSDTSVTITANFDGIVKTVTAIGFMTLNTLPEPLNSIWSDIDGLAHLTRPVVTQSSIDGPFQAKR